LTLAAFIFALAITLSAMMAAAAKIALSTGKSGWIDAIWSFSVGAAGVAAALVPLESEFGTSGRQWLVAGLIAAWSIRLGSHIVARTVSGGDDPRYAELKRQWGDEKRFRLFLFLQIQGACALVLAVCIMAAARNPSAGLGLQDFSGAAILAVALIGEAVADRQLRTFTDNPANKGKVCDVGLWAYSRHPNYFFEWLGWLAYVVIAIDVTGNYPIGWIALAGPALMYWLLVHASGIPPLEAHMLKSRGVAFKEYQGRVNAFWPGPACNPGSSKNPEKR
jgi:steroid 5-alpha reductase family enzyme